LFDLPSSRHSEGMHMATLAGRTARIALIVVGAVFALLLVAGPAAASTASPTAEARAIRLINNARENHGLRPLARNLQMTRHARDWAARMALSRRVSHRSDLAAVVDGDFRRLGENVGYTTLDGATSATLVRRLHRSFMNSSGHRYHILGDYNLVGVGVYRDRNGAMWMAVNFLKGDKGGFPLYRDIAGDSVETPVKRLFVPGVISGCDLNRFCPSRSVTRAEIARALQEVSGNTKAAAYMASTCSESSCAAESVPRVEAAHMVARALGLDPVAGRVFTDVSASDAGVVNAVVAEGLMTGCSSTAFCPGGTVSRARLATLLSRAMR
jgi:uncharacterized protein YkwD